jgi:hypothetical protein
VLPLSRPAPPLFDPQQRPVLLLSPFGVVPFRGCPLSGSDPLKGQFRLAPIAPCVTQPRVRVTGTITERRTASGPVHTFGFDPERIAGPAGPIVDCAFHHMRQKACPPKAGSGPELSPSGVRPPRGTISSFAASATIPPEAGKPWPSSLRLASRGHLWQKIFYKISRKSLTFVKSWDMLHHVHTVVCVYKHMRVGAEQG